MKKLLTFAIGLLASIASTNAQITCDFVYYPDTVSGVYEFAASPNIPPALYTLEWVFTNYNIVQYGPLVLMAYQGSGIDSVQLNIYGPDSNLVCSSIQSVNYTSQSGSSNCQIFVSNNPSDPLTLSFTASSNSPANWIFPDGTTTISLDASYTFPSAGTYTICANFLNGDDSCFVCIPVAVTGDTINPEPFCNSDFWASTSSLVGYYMPLIPFPGVSYSWDFGDGSTSTEMFPYHIYTTPGDYNVCLTTTSFSCFQNSCQIVSIPEYDFPPVDSTCYAGYVIIPTNPYELTIINASSGNNLEFTWTISGGGITMTASGAYPTINVQSTGSYLLCLDVASPDNCFSSFCDSIIVGDDGIWGGRISASGFSINVVSPQTITGFVTGIETAAIAPEMAIFPNPFSDFITISDVSNGQSVYNVFTVEGRKVLNGAINGKNQIITTSTLSSGIYFLQVISQEGKISTQKIVKK